MVLKPSPCFAVRCPEAKQAGKNIRSKTYEHYYLLALATMATASNELGIRKTDYRNFAPHSGLGLNPGRADSPKMESGQEAILAQRS